MIKTFFGFHNKNATKKEIDKGVRRVSLAVLFAILLGPSYLGPKIGWLEGLLFPVNTPAVIFNPQPAPPPTYRTRWQATAYKIRGECDFQYIEWHLGPRYGRKVEVVAKFLDPPEIRDEGLLEWKSLMISLSPEDTIENSSASAFHKCPWRPWLVETTYFDSELMIGEATHE